MNFGWVNFLFYYYFFKCKGGKKNQNVKIMYNVGLRYDERIRIWPQRSNRVTFEPLFGKKKLSKTGKIPDLANFRQFFWPQRRSNVIRFEFRGQIWNPFIIWHILGPHLT